MAKDSVSQGFDNFKNYEDKIKMASEKELKLFDDFYNSVKNHAQSHRHTTLNNLHTTQESLSSLKEKAEALKDSVFYHDETVIVDRQEIISQTEERIHTENRNILDYEFNQAGERIDSLDYLNKALIQTKYNYFDQFRTHYANQILDYDSLYEFYQNKVTEFDAILNRYNTETLHSFQELDDDITEMDSRISLLIQEKNSKLNVLNNFYSKEIKNYLDNQLTFVVEDDPTSLTVQALISDKISQLDAFKKHLKEQEGKVKEILNLEYQEIYSKTLERLLKRKGNVLVDDTMFFFQTEQFIFQLKQEIVEAQDNDFVSLKYLINKYNRAIKHKQHRKSCERKAKILTKKFLDLKKGIFLEYQKDTVNLIFQIEKYYKLYLELLRIDPFLAQIIGDNSTKIIRDEINFLSILQINKEHKINVNFDIKTLKLKQQINEIEAKLTHETEKQMHLQDIELVETIKETQLYFAEHQEQSAMVMKSLEREQLVIERLEKAINYHMEYMVKQTNLNRKFLSIISQILESDIRDNESHNIKVTDAASKIRLALKQYDIAALHFNTMFENEKNFLVMQSNRVSEETKINNEFILTTFENQMRFAGEQIMLANDEYRLRVEAIMRAIDEERNYYFDTIRHKVRKYKDREQNISDAYQAQLYHDTFLITDTDDKQYIKDLEKEIAKNKKVHDTEMAEIDDLMSKDSVISDAKRRLRELDDQFEVALEDAKILRDDTIDEMTELYHTAEQKYNTLKPYLDQKVNILDPTFFKTLDRIRQRHQYKLKAAEFELDEATKDLLVDYLKVYFEDKPEIDKDLYIAQIEQLEDERSSLKEEYAMNVEKSDLLYQTKMSELETTLNSLKADIETLKSSIVANHNKTIQQKQVELENLEKKYELNNNKEVTSFQNEINDLTKEYSNALIDNQRYYQNLSTAFNKILDSYYPYLKVAKNNKIIKQIVKENEKLTNAKKKQAVKKLKKESKLVHYLE